MASLGELLDKMKVRVTAPGAEIHAELRDRRQVTIWFGESVYEWIGERDLERHLAALARLLHVAYVREYLAARAAVDFEPSDVVGEKSREFREARAELMTTGSSPDGRIVISARDMHDFTVRLKPGTKRELTEAQFTRGAAQAVGEFLKDRRVKVRDLKNRVFGGIEK